MSGCDELYSLKRTAIAHLRKFFLSPFKPVLNVLIDDLNLPTSLIDTSVHPLFPQFKCVSLIREILNNLSITEKVTEIG
ncbi:hypothetical protein PVK06_018199 [Gossypium arboreum]|uniref:Uncharacterized protein n=1 Tax=Gossypium arboreum TaxID=29729 RepID=A0ABR0Q5K4_GOSAR|nr:hypothetical protein PVK06_018199 [Gossypium arboreum]